MTSLISVYYQKEYLAANVHVQTLASNEINFVVRGQCWKERLLGLTCSFLAVVEWSNLFMVFEKYLKCIQF